MSPPNLLLLLFLFLLSLSVIPSSSLSTVAISKISNTTIVCALLPSSTTTTLNCTLFPYRITQSYPSGHSPYSAIASGNEFLCALSPISSNTSTMRWWDFTHPTKNNSIPHPKRVYKGPTLSALDAGDSHVCGLQKGVGNLDCWRWPHLSVPTDLNLTKIAVGGDFVCGILDSGAIRCFGGDHGVVGEEPSGNYSAVAAGSRHACGVSLDGQLECWGVGAPKINGKLRLEISSLALGDNTTCVLIANGTVACWGENLELPKDYVDAPFMAIEAKGSNFCGILVASYSLVCWGSDVFQQNPVVFDKVLPGTCESASSCSCGVLADSGTICINRQVICNSCHFPSSPPNSTMIYQSSSSSNEKRRLAFILLGSIGFAVGLVAVFYLLFLLFRKKSGRVHDSGRLNLPVTNRAGPDPGIEMHLSRLFKKGHSSTIEEFPITVLLAVTDGFSESHKIGSGGFGTVYRATLDDGREVAIKRAYASASATASTSRAPRIDRESAFLAELALLSRVNHKNLVRLLGYCSHGPERILVYEFMTRGSLHDLLHKRQDSCSPLGSWPTRIRVALDTARGIEYLHSYAVPPIIHRDIKSSNILLDDTWTAKVSDFGLSLMSSDGENGWSNLSLRAAGTVGYMDPEYYRLQHLTDKSDVYSFGVVLLEILSGCRVIQWYEESGTPRNVVDFAVPHIVADDIHLVLDPNLPPPTPSEIEAVAYVGYLAADCVCPEGRGRPTMSEVVGGLERALAACAGPGPNRAWCDTNRSGLEEEVVMGTKQQPNHVAVD